MKSKHISKMAVVIGLAFVLLAVPLSTTPSAASKTEPVVINYVTFIPKMVPSIKVIVDFLSEVSERTDGRIVFKYRGGPEAIPPLDQFMAVKTGAVDMSYTPMGYYAGLTAAPGVVFTTEISAYNDRESGAYDFFSEIHDKVGLKYLTRMASPVGVYYQILTKKPIKRPQDLAGLQVSGGSIWDPIAAGLGMKTVIMPTTQYYSAMERGLIDVTMTAPDFFVSQKMWEVANYSIYPPFGAGGTALVMNPEKWSSIPKDLQDLMTDAMFEAMHGLEDTIAKNHVKARQILESNGIKPITFTGADAEWYLDTIYKSIKDFYLKKAPDDTAKLYDLLRAEALNK